MPELFYATHTIGDQYVRKEHHEKGFAIWRKPDGSVTKPSKGKYLKILPSPLLIDQPEPIVSCDQEAVVTPKDATVALHADAAQCVLRAAVWPDWNSANGYAESCRGDSATVLSHKGPNGEKVVKVTEVNPGSIRRTVTVLVPQHVEFTLE